MTEEKITECPQCQSKEIKEDFRNLTHDTILKIYSCSNCGFVKTLTLPIG